MVDFSDIHPYEDIQNTQQPNWDNQPLESSKDIPLHILKNRSQGK